MIQAWNEFDEESPWVLHPDEMSLLPGMTDKGRLGFAVQLKFRQINGRYPERVDEIERAVIHALAQQIGV